MQIQWKFFDVLFTQQLNAEMQFALNIITLYQIIKRVYLLVFPKDVVRYQANNS